MRWQDAKALIEEIRKFKCKKGHTFIERMEAFQPAVLSPADKNYLEYLYAHATGGGAHVHFHMTNREEG